MKRPPLFLALVPMFLFGAAPAHAQHPQSIFYMTREPKSARSFLSHADKVDILSPGWYAVDASGLLAGFGPPDATDRTAWLYFYRDDEREWIFYTDARTFKQR